MGDKKLITVVEGNNDDEKLEELCGLYE